MGTHSSYSLCENIFLISISINKATSKGLVSIKESQCEHIVTVKYTIPYTSSYMKLNSGERGKTSLPLYAINSLTFT